MAQQTKAEERHEYVEFLLCELQDYAHIEAFIHLTNVVTYAEIAMLPRSEWAVHAPVADMRFSWSLFMDEFNIVPEARDSLTDFHLELMNYIQREWM